LENFDKICEGYPGYSTGHAQSDPRLAWFLLVSGLVSRGPVAGWFVSHHPLAAAFDPSAAPFV